MKNPQKIDVADIVTFFTVVMIFDDYDLVDNNLVDFYLFIDKEPNTSKFRSYR